MMKRRNVTWLKENASNVNMATAYADTDAVVASSSHPRCVRSARAAAPARRMKRTNIQTEGERADQARLDEHSEPLVVEDRCIGLWIVSVAVVTRVANPSPKIGCGAHSLLRVGPGLRRRACPTGAFCCSAIRPPSGKNDALRLPIVPGLRNGVTSKIGSRAGHNRFICRGRCRQRRA